MRAGPECPHRMATTSQRLPVTAVLSDDRCHISFHEGDDELAVFPLEAIHGSQLLRDVMDSPETTEGVILPVQWSALKLWLAHYKFEHRAKSNSVRVHGEQHQEAASHGPRKKGKRRRKKGKRAAATHSAPQKTTPESQQPPTSMKDLCQLLQVRVIVLS